MLRKINSLFGLMLLAVTMAFAQGGTLQGTVTDDAGEPLPFANVSVEKNGVVVNGATTDFDGNYQITPIPAGSYTVKYSYVGYNTKEIQGIVISADKITFQPIKLSNSSTEIDEVEIVYYSKPLIDPDFKSGGTRTREEIAVSPLRSVAGIATNTAGVFASDDGSGDVNVRGSRSGSTTYFIDGIKVRGSSGLPQAGIEEVEVITGGVPAQYGDATGGIISVTTRGPAPKYFGGVELITSEGLDAYGYNLLGVNLSGPLVSRVDTALDVTRPILGFFIAGEFNPQRDAVPSAVGMWKVKDDVLADLEANPLRQSPTGQGTLKNSDFLVLDPNGDGDYSDGDFEKIKAKQNVADISGRLSVKFDFSPSKEFNFTLGGSAEHQNERSYIYEYALFNPSNNPQIITDTYRVFGRITHKLTGDAVATDEASSGNIKNAYYTIQADYSKYDRITQDDSHQDRYFDYGYVGEFNTTREEIYEWSDDLNAYELNGYRSTLYSFDPTNTLNANTAAYTSQYYDIYEGNVDGNYENWSQVQQGGALLNGDRPANVYSLWYNTGRQYGGFQRVDNSQFRLSGNASAQIKGHNIKFGFEYEERVDRQFDLSTISLWTLMRQYANDKNGELDTDNPIYVTDANGVFQDTVTYNTLYNVGEGEGFFENIRKELGISNYDFVDIDSYDPSTFNLGMFTPNELLNSGNGVINSLYGYDYEGNRLDSESSFDDFFTAKDEFGNLKREIPAFQPIYMSGYIQDKFTFKDIVVNVGVRVDRFDANQKVLKDQYLWYQTYDAGAYRSMEDQDLGEIPDNISDDAYIYVNDVENPSAIIGFREGTKWYNAQGTELASPDILSTSTTTGKINPWLVNPNDDIKSDEFVANKSFVDYVPQVNVMPRVSFSFPISDEAMFFAHYDILTQRPSASASLLLPTDYLFVENNIGGLLNNPNLKPERTTDYELGFMQTLSRSSALTLSAFYRELRDMIQVVNVNYAYPANYLTYGNIDFGTVKGFAVKYDLRRTNNVSINASYTLQFADGTGSGATSGLNLINSNQPNLRTLIPLDYDQRHRINATVDYRYGKGSDYDGPAWGKKIFQDAGANIIFNAGSGLPFTKQSNFTQDAAFGISERSTLKGSVNGARLPWQFRIDTRASKNIELGFGQDKKKKTNLNVYVQVQNLLDAKNVLRVYRATGNANDDGYLNAAQSQNQINGQVNPSSFRDLYTIKVNNPSYFALPRRIRLGVMLDF